MSIDVTVPASFSQGTQNVQDQNGASSALSLATNAAVIKGQDVVGSAMPLVIQGLPVGTGQQTWGRLLRLVGPGNQFFDLGIDSNGNLFLNGPGSTATNHLLTISTTGVITIS